MTKDSSQSSSNSVILIGLSGAGKTTCGKILAETLKWDFIDTDTVIETENGVTIANLFQEFGEQHFRKLERELLIKIARGSGRINFFSAKLQKFDVGALPAQPAVLSGAPPAKVIATGGGMPVDNFELLEKIGTIIYLEAQVPVLVRRLRYDTKRPLLDKFDYTGSEEEHISLRLNTLLAQRENIYHKAHFKMQTDDLNLQAVVQELLRVVALINPNLLDMVKTT